MIFLNELCPTQLYHRRVKQKQSVNRWLHNYNDDTIICSLIHELTMRASQGILDFILVAPEFIFLGDFS